MKAANFKIKTFRCRGNKYWVSYVQPSSGYISEIIGEPELSGVDGFEGFQPRTVAELMQGLVTGGDKIQICSLEFFGTMYSFSYTPDGFELEVVGSACGGFIDGLRSLTSDQVLPFLAGVALGMQV